MSIQLLFPVSVRVLYKALAAYALCDNSSAFVIQCSSSKTSAAFHYVSTYGHRLTGHTRSHITNLKCCNQQHTSWCLSFIISSMLTKCTCICNAHITFCHQTSAAGNLPAQPLSSSVSFALLNCIIVYIHVYRWLTSGEV